MDKDNANNAPLAESRSNSSSRQSLVSESSGSIRENSSVRRIIDLQVDITSCDQAKGAHSSDGMRTPCGVQADGFRFDICKQLEQHNNHHNNSNSGDALSDGGLLMSSSFHSESGFRSEGKLEDSPLPIFNRSAHVKYLKWHVKPKTVLFMVKISDHNSENSLVDVFMDMSRFLIEERSLKVYAEEWLCQLVCKRDDQLAEKLNAMPPVDVSPSGAPNIPSCVSQLLCYETGNPIDALADIIDLIVCLGGDGTLLHVNSLFQKLIPPVLPFYAGSLGFLMTLSTDTFRERIDDALTGNVRLTLRSRFCCVVCKGNVSDGRGNDSKGSRAQFPSEALPFPIESIVASHTVMNEVVVDRGQSPFLTHLDLFADNRFITKVQADGIIIATPTGSTAYSMAAGGSMVHPSVPCIVVTPICAHSLSFRPIILPANMEVRIAISEGARSPAYVSFDGRNRRELGEGEFLRVMTSIFPMPTVMESDHTGDWFHSLSHCLHWNVRPLQNAPTPTRILKNASDKQ